MCLVSCTDNVLTVLFTLHCIMHFNSMADYLLPANMVPFYHVCKANRFFRVRVLTIYIEKVIYFFLFSFNILTFCHKRSVITYKLNGCTKNIFFCFDLILEHKVLIMTTVDVKLLDRQL